MAGAAGTRGIGVQRVTTAPMTATDPRIQRVFGHFPGLRWSGNKGTARCPAHDDRTPSMSMSIGADDRVLVKCHAGCSFDEIVRASGADPADFFPERPSAGPHGVQRARPLEARPSRRELTLEPSGDAVDAVYGDPRTWPEVARFIYVDAAEQPARLVRRYESTARVDGEKPRKRFTQHGSDGHGGWRSDLGDTPPLLYRLPEVLAAVATGKTVYLVEGEGKAEALCALGVVATSLSGGAKNVTKHTDALVTTLPNADVVYLPDNDEPGHGWADQVAKILTGVARSLLRLTLPGLLPAGDVVDWLRAGGTREQLQALVDVARDPYAGQRFTLRTLQARPDLLVPPRTEIPNLAWVGRSTLFGGREKSGKSTLIGQAAAQKTRGGFFLDAPIEPGDVLIIGLEEWIGDLVQRMRRCDADPDRVTIVWELPGSSIAERLRAAEAHMRATKPAVTVIDSLSAYYGRFVESENTASEMQPLVQDLTNLAHTQERSIVLLHHATKSDGNYRGSSGIGAAVDVIATLRADEAHSAADPTLRHVRVVGRVPTKDFSYRLVGGEIRLAAPGEAPADLRVLDVIRATPGLSLTKIRDASGIAKDAVAAALQRLLEHGQIEDRGGVGGHAYVVASVPLLPDPLADAPGAGQGVARVGSQPGHPGLARGPAPKGLGPSQAASESAAADPWKAEL